MSRDERERLRDIGEAITTIRGHLEKAGDAAAARETPCSTMPFSFSLWSSGRRSSTSRQRLGKVSPRFLGPILPGSET